MLSAVAARKARLGLADSQRETQTASVGAVKLTARPSVQETIRTESKTGTKRKRNKGKSAHSLGSLKKRYFEEENTAVGRGQDVGENGRSDTDTGTGDDEDVDLNGAQMETSRSVTAKHTVSRRWSPSIPVKDSSDEGSDAGDVTEPAAKTTLPTPSSSAQNATLSTFQPVLDQNTFHLSVEEVSHLRLPLHAGDDTITMIVLEPEDTLTLLGTYTFVVVHGFVRISGVTVRPSKEVAHRVFAPRHSSVPVMRCLSECLAPATSSSFLPARFDSLGKHKGAVVILTSLRTGIEGLGSICKTFDGMFEPSRSPRSNQSRQFRLVPTAHLITDQTKDIQPFVVPNSWECSLASIQLPVDDEPIIVKPMVCLVKGPKKTGKSTFARTLLNRLTTRFRRVAFLECDPGQSEFTPAGMVALNVIEQPLFGPPFSHPTIPTSSHYIGATSPRSSPSHYLAAIQELLQFYRLDIQTPVDIMSDHEDSNDDRIADVIPLVVNTMGWTKGLGADLALRIEEMVQPTDVFDIQGSTIDEGWPIPHATTHQSPADSLVHSGCRLHVLEPIPTAVQSTHFSPADHRTLSILSYFHAIFPSNKSLDLRQISATSWNTALPLCAQLPYEVDCAMAFEKIILIGAGMEDVVPSELEQVLNGALVGLVYCEPGTIDMSTDTRAEGTPTPTASDSRLPYTQGSSPPLPSTSVCHGLALIRAMSPSCAHMHVITPLPSYFLAKSRVAVKGELEFPTWGMLDFRNEMKSQAGVEMDKAPFLQWNKNEGVGTVRRRVRRNLMRKGQM